MGLGGISMWQLLIVLLIVVLIFGTKRLKSIGGDLGGALKSFRKAMDSDEKDGDDESDAEDPQRLEGVAPDAEFAEQKDKSESS
ncbi:MAG: twin-arginine translocase TatA/TatE family subunit [Candidatus Rariloculaceae bacterium]